jgi:zona occludens toxin (predicted ATPase)
MLVWLLVLLLLFAFIYVVYRIVFLPEETTQNDETEQHYTFKI